MAGPTTEAVNDDVKALREDLHRLEVSIRGEIARVETSLIGQIGDARADVRELSTKVNGILTSIRLLAILVLTGLATAIWTMATLSATTKANDSRLEKIETSIDKLADAVKTKAH